MAKTITLEKVEKLVAQLPPQEQLKLAVHINERLGKLSQLTQLTNSEHRRREYAAQVEAFLTACDEVAEQIEGEFDSAEDLRRIREERTRSV